MKYFKWLIIILLLITPVSWLKSQSTGNRYVSTSDAAKLFSERSANYPFLVFTEIREQPIQWYDSLKTYWLTRDYINTSGKLVAQPGEYFVYQVGIWAFKKPVDDVNVLFSALKNQNGNEIPADKMTCFNKGGIDKKGYSFTKKVNVALGRVQALWMGIDLAEVTEGTYEGNIAIVADGVMQSIPIQLEVKGDKVPNHGFNDGKRLSRMAWLNTTTGEDNNITKGYKPVHLLNNRIDILGRSLEIAPTGLPAKILSYFEASNQFLLAEGGQVVSLPFRFIIEKNDGEIVPLKPGKIKFSKQTDSDIEWDVLSISDEIELACKGHMQFDGYVDFKLSLRSRKSLKIKDIRLEIPLNAEKAPYMMGLGFEGGLRPPVWQWKWDISRNQDMLWIGDVNGGLRIKWKAENYTQPLINVYYAFDPLQFPPSWGNEGKGGVNIDSKGKNVLVTAFSGQRELKEGDILNYDFELMITPLKVIDRKIKYGDRYFHGGGTRVTSEKIKLAEDAGANIINVHHAEDIYPFINYPYLDENVPELKQLVNVAHQHDIRLKLYYTTRELTKNLPEFWAFNSLNGEIIFPGPGNESYTAINKKGPAEWLKKNLREKYIPAWYNTIQEGKFRGEVDLSVITTPDSRLNNFYIGGLDWMAGNLGIDGVYVDDSALDGFTLRRARKIIDKYRPEGRIDFHSVNHFKDVYGYANCLNLYMDLLPYIDLVWIGEGRDYDRLPDHWLIEVSGIPFGLPGQMLQGGGNSWRGMVYGITNRMGWGDANPSEIWKFWDQYHIMEKLMIGYWDQKTPLKVNNDLVKATLYKGDEECIIAIANWSKEDLLCSLDINWRKLEFDKNRCEYLIPSIPAFQDKKSLNSLNELILPGGKGYLIVVRKK